MEINSSGYYKWLNRKSRKNRYEKKRDMLMDIIKVTHSQHKSYGYHRIAKVIRDNYAIAFSDNLIHKCCKFAGIKSKARKYKFKKIGEEHLHYPNLVYNKWNASKPLEIVVSDMTCIRHKGRLYEWTYVLDTFNNEILSHKFSKNQGDRIPYFNCLEDLKKILDKRQQTYPLTLHTDQGGVYSSRAFNEAHKNHRIIRSMSRSGTPTDNPIIESINGWIKEEMEIDFNLNEHNNLSEFLDMFVKYYNEERPAYALQYKSPIQYRIEQGFI